MAIAIHPTGTYALVGTSLPKRNSGSRTTQQWIAKIDLQSKNGVGEFTYAVDYPEKLQEIGPVTSISFAESGAFALAVSRVSIDDDDAAVSKDGRGSESSSLSGPAPPPSATPKLKYITTAIPPPPPPPQSSSYAGGGGGGGGSGGAAAATALKDPSRSASGGAVNRSLFNVGDCRLNFDIGRNNDDNPNSFDLSSVAVGHANGVDYVVCGSNAGIVRCSIADTTLLVQPWRIPGVPSLPAPALRVRVSAHLPVKYAISAIARKFDQFALVHHANGDASPNTDSNSMLVDNTARRALQHQSLPSETFARCNHALFLRWLGNGSVDPEGGSFKCGQGVAPINTVVDPEADLYDVLQQPVILTEPESQTASATSSTTTTARTKTKAVVTAAAAAPTAMSMATVLITSRLNEPTRSVTQSVFEKYVPPLVLESLAGDKYPLLGWLPHHDSCDLANMAKVQHPGQLDFVDEFDIVGLPIQGPSRNTFAPPNHLKSLLREQYNSYAHAHFWGSDRHDFTGAGAGAGAAGEGILAKGFVFALPLVFRPTTPIVLLPIDVPGYENGKEIVGLISLVAEQGFGTVGYCRAKIAQVLGIFTEVMVQKTFKMHVHVQMNGFQMEEKNEDQLLSDGGVVAGTTLVVKLVRSWFGAMKGKAKPKGTK